MNLNLLQGFIGRAKELERTKREGMSEYRWELAITICRFMSISSQESCNAIYGALNFDEINELNKMFPYYRAAIASGADLD